MAADSFVTFVIDQLSRVEGLGCRAMFGGHGLYLGPTFFGIIFAGRLYFKTSGATSADYVRRGMSPFAPNDRQLLRSYYEVPADVVEDRRRLGTWARKAAQSAAAQAAKQTGETTARPVRRPG